MRTPTPYQRGTILLQNCDYAAAIESFDETIRIYPKQANAFYGRGYAHGKLGQHELALQDQNEAIRINPRNGGAHYYRGLAHGELGDDQKSQQDIEKAEELGFNIPTGQVRPGC
ncbi:MAG: tetratricopeptide repeat protein [SAR202 cluster bacterium]|jgi:tetratricopeptide (TPR) repeat protein|nr:tetratricopeptide repeat protein [SAR202 cluster bacterium]